MWRDFDKSVPPHLKEPAEKVKMTILSSKANSTVKSYLGRYKRWKQWCGQNHVCPLPVDPFLVAVYLQTLRDNAASPSPILNAVYSIDWALQLAGLNKVSAHPLVSSMVAACQRSLGRPRIKKEPITADMLKTMVQQKLKDKCPSLLNIRAVALCLTGYAGFFRYSDLANIRACDVKISSSFCRIFLETSKTDQLREGSWVVIARSDLFTCPVKALERYIEVSGLDLEEDLPLFRAISSTSSSSKLRKQGLSYTRVREIIKDCFKEITDTSTIGVHSLRAGGASAAANAGISDRLFKRHGRWSSENAKDGYIKDNMDKMLSVTRALGI